MIRTGLAILCATALAACWALSCLLVTPAQAEELETQGGRYSFHRADDGYLRLDERTGQVTLCNRRPAGWLCQAVPDDRLAFEAEIARLQIDNAMLKKELLTRNLPLPGGVRQDATGSTPDRPQAKPQVRMPTDADVNKVVVFIESVWRRIVEMVASVQKELMRRI
jgi:hypothetical protein